MGEALGCFFQPGKLLHTLGDICSPPERGYECRLAFLPVPAVEAYTIQSSFLPAGYPEDALMGQHHASR